MLTLESYFTEKGIEKGIEKGELEKSQKTLIKLLQKKFGIDEFEMSLINDCKDIAKLDNALDEILFANNKDTILDLLR